MADAQPQPLRLALVGCGVISRHHIDAIATLGGRILVTAIIEPNAERQAAAVASCTGGGEGSGRGDSGG